MSSMTLTAPAKVNYLLDVVSRRPDGYHDLRMVMQRVSLCDDITITLTGSPDIIVRCGARGVPDGAGNIAWKAARIMLERAGNNRGVDIAITKNIPVAAGLGGGSSDAASVLMGMNELLGLGLNDRQLMEIGVTLGADVPFFIFKETALAEGIGDILTAIPDMPTAWLVLVNPGVHVSTAWVYRTLKLTNRSGMTTLPSAFKSAEEISSLLSNDLEYVTIPAFPVIAEIKNRLLQLGAAGALMSGSGPTVFGVFCNRDSAEQACREIKNNSNWFVAAVQTI